MFENQGPQMLELCDCEVASVHSSQALLPKQTDPNVSRLDHRAVIGTIADSEGDILLVDIFNGFDDLCFLKWAQTAADDCAHGFADF